MRVASQITRKDTMNHDTSMSPYAPVRYRQHGWWQFARDVAREGFVSPAGQIASNLPDIIMTSLCQPMVKAAAEHFSGHPEGGQIILQFTAKTFEYRHWVPLAAQYELCGRQIFDLSDELVEMLSQTDIGDCTLEDWHAPFDTFFVSFGKQETMKVPFEDDYEYLDGAFVAVTPWSDAPGDRRIKFGFTTVHKDGSGVQTPGIFLDLNPSEQKMPILEGISTSITRRVSGMSSSNESREAAALSACRRGMLEEGLDLMKQAVSLLVNALFYIESVANKDGAGTVEPGRDTPPEQVVAWAQQPHKRHKLRTKLTSDGYVIVRMLGKEIASTGGARAGAGVKTHWRRGHWRQQRVGPQRLKIERRWVRPTMVNADRPHDDLPGHIYTVGGSGDGTTRH